MGTYIRTLDDAIASVAEILELPEQRDRIIQCTIRIMLCLSPESRGFLADSQALLIEGGLEALRKKRRDLIESIEDETTVAVLDPEEDDLFESVGSGLDALRLSEVAYRVFPDLRRIDRWRVARGLLRNEPEFERLVAEGVKLRPDGEAHKKTAASLERLIEAESPAWASRVTQIREVCRAFFAGVPAVSEKPAEDAEILFAVFTVDDVRADQMMAALDQGSEAAEALAQKVFDCLKTLRQLQENAA